MTLLQNLISQHSSCEIPATQYTLCKLQTISSDFITIGETLSQEIETKFPNMEHLNAVVFKEWRKRNLYVEIYKWNVQMEKIKAI